MYLIKGMFAGFMAVSVCTASISGSVTDTSGAAIAGATVQLEKGGQSVTTDENGYFTLLGGTSIRSRINNTSQQSIQATIKNGLLCLTVAQRNTVEVTTFNINGKKISTLKQILDAGTHSIPLLQKEAGVYLHKIKLEGKKLFIMSNSMRRTFYERSFVTHVSLTNDGLAKQKQSSELFNDVIEVSKCGYLTYSVIITSSDTMGIEIKMLPNAGNITDVDGNVYQTVKLGNQVWTVNNLRVTRFNDGTPIPLIPSAVVDWMDSTTAGYCFYGNTTDTGIIKKFGALYNWYAVDPANNKKIAPAGWHVATDADWDILQNYLIENGFNWDGTTTGNKIAKSLESRTDWMDYSPVDEPTGGAIVDDLSKNNTSGFSALPGGNRSMDSENYSKINFLGYWWAATEIDTQNALGRMLYYGVNEGLAKYGTTKKECISVRLIRE
jgi:uncharacterized protein (TIGR02145 family)